MSYLLRHLTGTVANTSMLTALFCDEADAWGTVFTPPLLPVGFSLVIEELVTHLAAWSVNGMPLEEMSWQAASTQIVEFKNHPGGSFPRGMLAEIEISCQGQIRLYLSDRRLSERSVEEWTKKCYNSILHYYRVLKPLQDRFASVNIVRLF